MASARLTPRYQVGPSLFFGAPLAAVTTRGSPMASRPRLSIKGVGDYPGLGPREGLVALLAPCKAAALLAVPGTAQLEGIRAPLREVSGESRSNHATAWEPDFSARDAHRSRRAEPA